MRALSLGALFLLGCSQYLDFSSTRSARDSQLDDAGLDGHSFDAARDVAIDTRDGSLFDAARDPDAFVDSRSPLDAEIAAEAQTITDGANEATLDSAMPFDAEADAETDRETDTAVATDTAVEASFDAPADAPPPIPAPGFLSLGTYHSCASFTNDAVCWGRSYDGDISSLQVADIVQMDSAREAACAVHRNGSISCWGNNFYGALGDGTMATRQTPGLVVDLEGLIAREVAVGGDFACARFDDGSVRCWGINLSGQLGIGVSNGQRTRPALVAISNVTQIVAGSAHVCVLLQNGELRCWGSGGAGQLGDGRRASSNVPVRVSVSSPSRVENIAAGGETSCLVTRAGDVYCWGMNSSAQAGNPSEGIGGSLQWNSPRLAFGGVQPGAELAVGLQHSCLREGSTVRCWGGNYQSQLGQGFTSFGTWEPQVVDVEAWNGPGSLKAGGAHTCVRRPDSALACWGSNQQGQIGSGTELQTTPLLIARN